ncbi:hypothetical protein BDV06DRAFT_214308 [Aspergillus oleicola]
MTSHSYYPSGLQLPHYTGNKTPVVSMIAQFGVFWAAVLGIGYLIVRSVAPTSNASDQVAFVWMCLTGSIHLFFESYFVIYHEILAGSGTLFGQLWKEYSLSDSRQFAWGPLAFFIAYCIPAKHPLCHPLQLILSVGQVYGDMLYFGTSLSGLHFYGVDFCRPEGYFFGYAVQSVQYLAGAVREFNEMEDGRKAK